ncbi:hypothetical protein DERF_002070 [Dermatophagoides farinae]|uniref:Uncharacterized protein n=1 Tax=Dermatophagoides farinae TaxID=6954 RepID=A0A922LA35_DERFA|nr:hypothetical protein DERF_002070 [Dermatophagoides farinae]
MECSVQARTIHHVINVLDKYFCFCFILDSFNLTYWVNCLGYFVLSDDDDSYYKSFIVTPIATCSIDDDGGGGGGGICDRFDSQNEMYTISGNPKKGVYKRKKNKFS